MTDDERCEFEKSIDAARRMYYSSRGGDPIPLGIVVGALIRAVELLAGSEQFLSATKKVGPEIKTIGLIESNDGKTAICVDGGRLDGWKLYRHPGGQWVSECKATAEEIAEARTQWANAGPQTPDEPSGPEPPPGRIV